MNIKSFVRCGVVSALLVVSAQAMARIVTLAPMIHGFNRVTLQGSGQLILRQGAQDSVTVQVDRRAVPFVNVYKSNHVLNLGLKSHDGMHFRDAPLYTVTMRHIRGITDANSGLVQVHGPIVSKQMDLTLNNSGSIHIPILNIRGPVSVMLHNSGQIHIRTLHADSVAFNLANSGHIYVHDLSAHQVTTMIRNSGNITIDGGHVYHQDISLNNSGQFNASQLVSHNANILLRNSGAIYARVLGNVTLTKHGSGQLYLYGHPQVTVINRHRRSGIHMMG